MNSEYIVILTTCPDESTANRIAAALVREGLAACVNRLAAFRSTYRWQGQVQDEPEVLLLIKTAGHRYGAVEMRLKALHPYAIPEIIALPVVAGSGDYLAWLARESAGAQPPTSGTAAPQ